MGNKRQKKNIFFAYQSGPSDNVDAITSAINEFNKQNSNQYFAESWESLKINGAIINKKVLKAIDDSEVFACDLTYMNHNVLFELGYAIGRKKKLFLLLNENIKGAKENYVNSKILKNIGYTSFKNSKEILKGLREKHDFETIIIEELVNIDKIDKDCSDIFYIHSSLMNQAEIQIQENLKESIYDVIRDDSTEIEYQTLTWYIQSLIKCKSVIIHFMGKDKNGDFVENAQHSVYAGLGCGLSKHVLLIAPFPFNAPIDYTDILIEYKASMECVQKVSEWISTHLQAAQKKTTFAKQKEEHDLNLLRLGLGCEIAEEEKADLEHYFIETNSYKIAFEKKKAIFVGRKGTGKSALYIKLENDLKTDNTNYIIALKPESSELLENVEMSRLYNSEASKKSFFLNVWKFVLFSKLITTISNRIKNKKVIYYTQSEEKILKFAAKYDTYINFNFFGFVKEINKKATSSSLVEDPEVLNTLNIEFLGPLFEILKDYFKNEKYFKIIIIADNLDKTWDSKNDLSLQAEMILTLLEYSDNLEKEFINRTGNKVDVKTYIFLRNDIFDFIKKQAREPDKLTINSYEINWENFPSLLKQLIEARFRYILEMNEKQNIEFVWKDYFEIDKKKSSFDMIKDACVLRPRDIIYFVSKLFESAINNGNSKVQYRDFEYAVNAYTSFLHMNLIAETSAEFPNIGEILSKLQQDFSQAIDYIKFKSIISNIEHDSEKADKIIDTLFTKGYLVGIDVKGKEMFSDAKKLHDRNLTKQYPIVGWFLERIFRKRFYIVAHPKYQTINRNKNMFF
jgi:hypothetical protein